MKKAMLVSCLAAGLMTAAGLASAADDGVDPGPLQLSEHQLDGISAGQTSTAGGWATAVFGTASSNSQAGTFSSGPVSITSASSLNLAIGVGTDAGAWGWSTF